MQWTTEMLLWGALIIFAAGFTQGTAGFGFGLVTMSLLPLFLDVKEAVPIVGIFSVSVNLVLLWGLRHEIDRRKILPLLLGGAVGAPLGVTFLVRADTSVVLGVLGMFLLAYVAWSVRPQKAATDKKPVNVLWGVLAGAVGGTLQAALGTGGPPVVAYTAATSWSMDGIKATLQLFFLAGTTVQLVFLAREGLLTGDSLSVNLWLAPALALGVFTGIRLYDRISQVVFRRILLSILTVIGVRYLLLAFG